MSLVSLLYAIEVGPATEWKEIFDNYAPLIRLARAERVKSPQLSPRGCRRSLGISSGDDEDRVSPASSPVAMPAELVKYLELTAPITVELPPPIPDEELAVYSAYVQHYRAKEEAEKAYIAFIFQEYCKRKAVEQKEQHEMDKLAADLAEARSRELPLHVRNLLGIIADNEANEREEIHAAYDGFLKWIAETTPLWLEAVHKQEEENRRQAEAKRAALAAAKAALAEELARAQKLSPDLGSTPEAGGLARGDLGRGTPSPVRAVAADGTPNYSPSVYLDRLRSGASSPETQTPAVELTESELRKKAIMMLEREEVEMRKRREEQLQRLRAQEDAIKAKLEAKEQERSAAEARQHEDERARRYRELLEQENALRGRLGQRDEQQRQEEEQRRLMLEHIAAEEELLRQRLKEQEDRRHAAEAAKAREEQRAKEELYEHVKAEEELLRQRLKEQEDRRHAAEAAKAREEQRAKEELYEHVKAEEELLRQRMQQREAERQRQATLAEEARRREQAAREEQRRIQKEQDEALRRAKKEHERRAKEQQLRYLAEQEESVKARLRAKELAALQQRERELAERQQRAAASSYYSSSPAPLPPAGYYDPYRTAPTMPAPVYPAMPTAFPPPQAPAPYPQPYPQPYGPAVAGGYGGGGYPQPSPPAGAFPYYAPGQPRW